MNHSNHPQFLDQVIIRTPAFETPGAFIEDLYTSLMNSERFMEALALANPFIYDLAIGWHNGLLVDEFKIGRLKETLLNYYVRTSTNATPFGLFSSVSSLNWGETAVPPLIDEYQVKARLDTFALFQLLKKLNEVPAVKRTALYFPNNTIYKIGEQYRYLETYEVSQKMTSRICRVEYSELLMEIFTFSKYGVSIPSLTALLKNQTLNDYDESEIYAYLDELIESQLLCSELQVNITGGHGVKEVLAYLKALDMEPLVTLSGLIFQIESINGLLEQLSDGLITVIAARADISNHLYNIGCSIEPKYVLQIDLYHTISQGKIPESIQSKLSNAIRVISYFSQNSFKPRLESLKTQLVKNYEQEGVSLLHLLDTEHGIGFGKFKFKSTNIMIDDGLILKSEESYLSINPAGHKAKNVLQKKFLEAKMADEFTIFLNDRDFEGLPSRVEELAPTFQIIFSILDARAERLVINTVGNGSAGCLLSRFGNDNADIKDALLSISNFEQLFYGDAIVAEIVHLSEPRTGNLSLRPRIRDYEIPLVNRSFIDHDFQIELSDLFVCVRNNKLILYSKKLRKRIIPTLTTAHNYNKQTNPIYQFLAELQYQDVTPSMAIDISDMANLSVFTPRIQYQDVILQRARWEFAKDHFLKFVDASGQISVETVLAFKAQWKIPDHTRYYDLHTITYLDWSNIEMLKPFLRYVAKTGTVVLEEFLLESNQAFVRDSEFNAYYHECIALVKNTLKDPATSAIHLSEKLFAETRLKRSFFPGEEWLYFKIYCSETASDELLKNEIMAMVKRLKTDHIISQFFFIRFNDPDHHLRIRLRLIGDDAGLAIKEMNLALDEAIKSSLVRKIQLDTYSRELERYQNHIHFCESIFDADSQYWMDCLSSCFIKADYYLPVLFLKGVTAIFEAFEWPFQNCVALISRLSKAYEAEFQVTTNKKLIKHINAKVLSARKLTEMVLNDDLSPVADAININRYALISAEFKASLKQCLVLHPEIGQSEMNELIGSIVHMHAIRCFKTKPRENELFAYNALYRYYKKLSAIKKEDQYESHSA